MPATTRFQVNQISSLAENVQKLQKCDQQVAEWMESWMNGHTVLIFCLFQLCWQGTKTHLDLGHQFTGPAQLYLRFFANYNIHHYIQFSYKYTNYPSWSSPLLFPLILALAGWVVPGDVSIIEARLRPSSHPMNSKSPAATQQTFHQYSNIIDTPLSHKVQKASDSHVHQYTELWKWSKKCLHI